MNDLKIKGDTEANFFGGKECSRRVTPWIMAISMAGSDERELGLCGRMGVP